MISEHAYQAAAALAPFLPFALPDIGQEEIDEVVDSLRSGWLTTGPKAMRFERDFADYIGGGVEAIGVCSGTAGLHLALEALGIGPGDEVITTTYTFTATAEVIRYLGARPVFVDVDPHTLNMDPERVEAAITDRTRAIVPVHFGGLACAMPAIIRIAKAHGLKVVEDAAHALPTTCGGTLIGALDTDATVFSFYATKTLATGEGGMLVTRRPEIADRCRVMRLHGIDRDAYNRYTSETPAWRYQIVAAGFKYNMTDLAASIGIHQLRRVAPFQKRRAEMAQRYVEGLTGLPLVMPADAASGERHAWHLFVVRLADGAPIGRDAFIDEMAARRIGTSVHFIPLHVHPYWRDTCGHRPEDFPVALDAYRRVVSLPIYTRMTVHDQERVIDAARAVLDC